MQNYIKPLHSFGGVRRGLLGIGMNGKNSVSSYRDVILERFSSPFRRRDERKIEEDLATAKRLFNEFPNIKFWKNVDMSEYPDIFSPAFLLSENVFKDLKMKYKHFCYTPEKHKKTEIGKDKIGADYVLPPKNPKNISEFLTF